MSMCEDPTSRQTHRLYKSSGQKSVPAATARNIPGPGGRIIRSRPVLKRLHVAGICC